MQTVDKALSLLDCFTTARPEIGLSELARLSGYDKAATRRFLVALQRHAFIEQNPIDKKYRLGAAFLHFAQVREASQPLAAVVLPRLEALTRETDETSHASHYAAGALATIGMCAPGRATRVHVDPSETLPLNATASGLAYLAFGPPERLDETLAQGIRRYTRHTISKPDELRRAVEDIRRTGVSVCDQGFEEEVVGIAMPYFNGAGVAVGAIAVATPTSRMTNALRERIVDHLHDTVLAVTEGIGGAPGAEFLDARAGRRAA